VLFVEESTITIYSGGLTMKSFIKTALTVVSLMLCAGVGFAADVKAPAADSKAAAKASAVENKDNIKAKAADTKTAVKAKIVDINSATEAELKAVPGIGDAYAAKIIAGRPYANKTQLKSRKIIPATLYEQVKDQLIAKQKK
jgi:competence protein ComEA